MTNSNLPIIKNNKQKDLKTSSVIKINNKTKISSTLVVSSLLLLTTSLILTLNQFPILSIVIGFIGVLFLLAWQLIKNSLSLTEKRETQHIDSTLNTLQLMKIQVSKTKFLEFVEAEGSQTAHQAHLLLEQYKNLKHILNEKFEINEVTFIRYLEHINLTCLAISDTLIYITNNLENLSAIGKNKSEQWNNQLNHVHQSLKSTDEALTSLADLFNSINQVITKENHRDQLEQTIQQLKKLTDRVQIYSKQ